MPTDPSKTIAELLATPLEEVLVGLASGIGRSQEELDRHSIETQRRIMEDPQLAQYGLEATWYQIPSAELELKMSVVVERAKSTSTSPTSPILKLPKIWAQPINPRITNQFSFDANAASTVKLSIVAVPPPGSNSATPTRTREDILAIARDHLLKLSDGSIAPRVSIQFNGGAGAWFVVQTTETSTGDTQLATLIKIDDHSGAIVRQTGGI